MSAIGWEGERTTIRYRLSSTLCDPRHAYLSAGARPRKFLFIVHLFIDGDVILVSRVQSVGLSVIGCKAQACRSLSIWVKVTRETAK